MAGRRSNRNATNYSAASAGRAGTTRSVYGRMSTRINPRTGNQIASGATQGFSMYSGGPVSNSGRMMNRTNRYREVRRGLGLSAG